MHCPIPWTWFWILTAELSQKLSLCIPLLMSSSKRNYCGMALSSVYRLQTLTTDEAWCWLRAICNCGSVFPLYFFMFCITHSALPPSHRPWRRTLQADTVCSPSVGDGGLPSLAHVSYFVCEETTSKPSHQILGSFFCHGWYWAELSPAFSILPLLTNSTFGKSIVFPWGTEGLVVQKATVPFKNLTFEQDETRIISLRGQPHFRDKIPHSGLLCPL